MEQDRFSHVDRSGHVRMVDVSEKSPTRRVAEAHCVVRTRVRQPLELAERDGMHPILAAQLAGVMTAKSTASLIPLCHPIDVSQAHVEITPHEDGYQVSSHVVATQRTGVEMEALSACAIAALSLVSALKDADPEVSITGLGLDFKSGGRSGEWGRRVQP